MLRFLEPPVERVEEEKRKERGGEGGIWGEWIDSPLFSLELGGSLCTAELDWVWGREAVGRGFAFVFVFRFSFSFFQFNLGPNPVDSQQSGRGTPWFTLQALEVVGGGVGFETSD